MRKTKYNGKILVGALCGLAVLIVLLVIVIVVLNRNKQTETVSTTDTDDAFLTEEDKAMLAKQEAESDEQAKKFTEFENLKSQIREEASSLLTQTPVDVPAVSAIYDKYINKYKDSNEISYVTQLIFDERNLFLESNLQNEALESLISRDYTIFPKWKQYEFYYSIISIAKDLNRTDIITAYEPLYNEAKSAWDIHVKAIEDYATPGESADESNEENIDD